jgi:quinoprotein glucose dehydrogenase
MHRVAILCLAAILSTAVSQRGGSASSADWSVYAADQAATHYSPLDGITPENVARLTVAWEWRPGEAPRQEFGARPGNFQNTPLMIDGVLYVSTPYNQVAALDAETGRELWRYDPKAYEAGQPPNGTGFVHRGVAAWRDPAGAGAQGSAGGQLRIFLNSRWKLIALDARTGEPITTFGTNGVVDLTEGLRRPVKREHYTNTSPPVVYRNLVILGNGVGDRLVYQGDPPGDVRAFDARTGKQVWRFNTIPDPGERGHDTWGNGSWKRTGHTNVWAPMSLDEPRGLLYLPVSTAGNDFYGGDRPGANLYSESLVCLDAATGAYKWHFQIVHHGLWDYDPASAPNLVTIERNGRRVDAVVQLTKQGLAFVFDRVSGAPIWPIEERAVPASDVAGETAWPTQPFPTRPAALAAQGMGPDTVFDLTPELKRAAEASLARFRVGPIYTPPSVQGTVMVPGIIGGANWGGAAFDPETRTLYVKVSNQAAVAKIAAPDRSPNSPRAGEVDAAFVGDLGTSATFTPPAPPGFTGRMPSLPLIKPPYGELVAIRLDTGDIAWRVPFGDTPSIRAHPLLQGVALPARLGAAGAPGVIVTKSGLILGGGGDSALYAFDARTGKEVWHLPLARRVTSTPMTYRSRTGAQSVIVATGSGADAMLVALK